MKHYNWLRLCALVVLGAFVSSFYLPFIRFIGLESGWSFAAVMAEQCLHWSDFYVIAALLYTAEILIIPIVLVVLTVPRFALRLPRFIPWLIGLVVVYATFVLVYLAQLGLCSGCYVWWSCQIATVALAFWNRSTRPSSFVEAAPTPQG